MVLINWWTCQICPNIRISSHQAHKRYHHNEPDSSRSHQQTDRSLDQIYEHRCVVNFYRSQQWCYQWFKRHAPCIYRSFASNDTFAGLLTNWRYDLGGTEHILYASHLRSGIGDCVEVLSNLQTRIVGEIEVCIYCRVLEAHRIAWRI